MNMILININDEYIDIKLLIKNFNINNINQYNLI